MYVLLLFFLPTRGEVGIWVLSPDHTQLTQLLSVALLVFWYFSKSLRFCLFSLTTTHLKYVRSISAPSQVRQAAPQAPNNLEYWMHTHSSLFSPKEKELSLLILLSSAGFGELLLGLTGLIGNGFSYC